MNYANKIGMEGVGDANELDPQTASAIGQIVARFEAYRTDMADQLRKEPTVFYANPDTELEKVAGAKQGDVAVWRDDAGVDQFRILGLD